MPSHSNPSIMQQIEGTEGLFDAYTALTNAQLTAIRGLFAERIALPTAVNANVVHVQEELAQYASALTPQEFIAGARNALPTAWRQAHPIGTDRVIDLVTECVRYMLAKQAVWQSHTYTRTVGGASMPVRDPWQNLDQDLYVSVFMRRAFTATDLGSISELEFALG